MPALMLMLDMKPGGASWTPATKRKSSSARTSSDSRLGHFRGAASLKRSLEIALGPAHFGGVVHFG
jgi:hypothetical protein